MQIICISRGGYGFSNTLAEKLSDKTGYPCINRGMILDEAAENGLSIGKLEVQVVKKAPITEALKMEADRYKAFVAARLCKTALENGGLIYHGRAGHLVFPGLQNVLSIRVIGDQEVAITEAMTRMNINRNKAKRYVEESGDDIKRWVKTMYQKDCDDPLMYDITINSSHFSTQSAAEAVYLMTKLPECHLPQESQQRVKDILLASECHLELARNEKTKNISVKTSAERGHVSVNYLPAQAEMAEDIPHVLEAMKDVKSFVCTVASTNILCVGDRFDPNSETFDSIIDIAEKWNAAVAMVRIAPEGEAAVETNAFKTLAAISPDNGGILEENESAVESIEGDNYGLKAAMDKLIQCGRAGLSHTISGGEKRAVEYIMNNGECSLVVVGDIFTKKAATQSRLKRDFINLLSDKIKTPIIAAEDLKSQYLFGTKQMINLVFFGLLAGLIYLGTFFFQERLLGFISAGQSEGLLQNKILASVTVALCVPVIAYIIGGFYSNLLKLIRLE